MVIASFLSDTNKHLQRLGGGRNSAWKYHAHFHPQNFFQNETLSTTDADAACGVCALESSSYSM
jgi:hypothetical protein